MKDDPQEKHKILMIISCTKTSARERCKAKDMYKGNIFIKAQKLAKFFAFHTLILSVKYGLIGNEDEIEPYDKTVKDIDIAVVKQINETLKRYILAEDIKTVIIILGEPYFDIIKEEVILLPKRIKAVRMMGKNYKAYVYKITQLIRFGELYSQKIFSDIKTEKKVSFADLF